MVSATRNDSKTNHVIITGTKNTVLDMTGYLYMDNTHIRFEGVSIKTKFQKPGSDYTALYCYDVTYVDCAMSGFMLIGRDGAKFIGCSFDLRDSGDYIRTYGNNVSFDGCTFESDGKALLIYSDGNGDLPKVSVTNCVFNATQGGKAYAIANQNCAAIEIDNYGCGVDLTFSGLSIDEDFSGTWRIKTYYDNGTTILVNGVEYTTIALDGKTMTVDADKNVTVHN